VQREEFALAYVAVAAFAIDERVVVSAGEISAGEITAEGISAWEVPSSP